MHFFTLNSIYKKIWKIIMHLGNINAIYYTKAVLLCSVHKTFPSTQKVADAKKEGYWRKVKKCYTMVMLFKEICLYILYFLNCCRVCGNFFVTMFYCNGINL